MNRQHPRGISYCDWSWSPIRGCRRVSPGCSACYAERIAARFARPRLEIDHNPDTGEPAGVVRSLPFTGIANMTPDGPRWTGEVDLVESKLDEPLRARRSAEKFLREHGRQPIVFVCDMSDLFYERVPDAWIADVLARVRLADWFDYLILTKRAERMAALLGEHGDLAAIGPLPHVLLGVSAEDQQRFDERVMDLLKLAKAGWRTWISFEPLLGPIDTSAEYFTRLFGRYPFPTLADEHRTRMLDLIDRIAIGGESGPGARPCAVEWIESLVDQARNAGVQAHVKQLGRYPVIPAVPPEMRGPAVIQAQHEIDLAWPLGTHFGNPTKDPALGGRVALLHDSHGGDPEEWPERLRVREWPARLREAR